MSNMVREFISRYKTDDMHLLIPSAYIGGIEGRNPFYQVSVSEVKVDTDADHHEIYSVGSEGYGKNRKDLYALAKPALERFAAAAGISIISASSYTRMVDDFTVIGHVEAALLTPDGSPRLMTNEKVIDMRIEEKRIRVGQKEAVKNGLSGKAGKNAASMYDGDWKEQQSKDGGSYSRFFIAVKDQEVYVKAAVELAMIQLWKDVPQKAWTGAWLRVIRSALNMRPTYTKAELSRPFYITRLDFHPDYGNPTIRQMALEQGFRSMGMLFASRAPAVQVPPAGYNEVPGNAVPAATGSAEPTPPVSGGTADASPARQGSPEPPAAGQTPDQTGSGQTEEHRIHCSCCDKEIRGSKEKLDAYSKRSIEKYGRVLCVPCAKEADAATGKPVPHVCADCGKEIKFRDADEKKIDDYCRRSQMATGRVLCPVCAKKEADAKADAETKKTQAEYPPALGPYEFVCKECGEIFDMAAWAQKNHMDHGQIVKNFEELYGGPLCGNCCQKHKTA